MNETEFCNWYLFDVIIAILRHFEDEVLLCSSLVVNRDGFIMTTYLLGQWDWIL